MLRLLAARPAALRFLRLAVPPDHLRFRSVERQVRRPRPRAHGKPVPAPRQLFKTETTRPPGFPGSPLSACPALRPRRDPHLHGHGEAQMLSSRKVTMSTLAHVHLGAQSPGLLTSCERFAARVTPGLAHHSVPAGGRPWPDGVYTRGASNKVSKITSRHLVPLDRAFPGALLSARHERPCCFKPSPSSAGSSATSPCLRSSKL